ncbi:MAG: (2Fe-2S)-binding protein [Chloroflexi bacterium]|nr:(2Fe-2S)-binding protein [Chloroflexota bacterium]
MAEITVTLNGKKVSGREGMTILELARENGIEIPTLCYVAGLTPTGACRVCVVDVEGSRTLVGSCHTPLAPGMVIQTHSPKVLETRKMVVELLLASHCGTCYMCEKANVCELRRVAADLEVGIPRFQNRKRYYPVEDASPYLQRDLSKCILCRKCVRACREIAKQNVFGMAYRGFDSKVVVDLDEPINKEVCRDCDVCISVCPTGALSKPKVLGEEKKGKPLIISR